MGTLLLNKVYFRRCTYVATLLAMWCGVTASLNGADFSANWLGGTGNWTNGSLWSTSPAFPNNGAGGTFDAAISAGMVTLNQGITIQRLILSGGEVNGSSNLTLNEGLSWSRGHLYSTGAINLAAGSISTFSSEQLLLRFATVNNFGSVTQNTDVAVFDPAAINNKSGSTWNIQQHYLSGPVNPNYLSFNNDGNFAALDATLGGTFNNSGTVTIQSNIGTQFTPGGLIEGVRTYHGLSLSGGGTLSGEVNMSGDAALVLGPSPNIGSTSSHYQLANGLTVNGGTVAIVDDVDVVGTVTVNSTFRIEGLATTLPPGGFLALNGPSRLFSGVLVMNGGTILNPAYPLLTGPSVQLFGFGTIDGDVTATGTNITATFGHPLRIGGDLKFQYFVADPPYDYQTETRLLMTLTGSQFGNSFLSIGGSMEIDRSLLTVADNLIFESEFHNGDTFTLIQTGNGFSGEFRNAHNRQRFPVSDKAWFQMNYGNASAYAPHDLVLSDGFISPLSNGIFERSPGRNVVGTVQGWNVIGNVAEVDDEGYVGAYRCLSLSRSANSQNDSIYQSFSTTIGQTYSLDFDSGIFGIPNGDVLRVRVQVFGNGTLVDDTQEPPVAGTFDPNAVIFHHYHYVFTANSTSTTLQFTNIGLGNTGADELLDNVVVGPPLPTPPPTVLPLRNGDFESPQYESLGIVEGWTVSGNGKLKATGQGSTSGVRSAAFDPTGDSQGNTLSQSFVTVPGGVYLLDFDAGIFGKPAGAPLQLRTQVLGTATRLDQTLTPPNANTWDANQIVLQHYHFVFTADSSITTLKFTDIGTGNAAADIELDTVSVVPRLTSAIQLVSGPSPSGSIVQVNGSFLPGTTVKVSQNFNLQDYTDLPDVQCDANGSYSINVNLPPDRTAVFFRVTAPVGVN